MFVDFVTEDELSVLYRNALALVYPSKYEGFGLPVLEAMAEECPVVCSEAASLPEVGGDAALYFDPTSLESLESALTQLLSSDRHEMVQRGIRNVARFSWDRSTKALVEVYRGLADARP
jgi:glycosyltransferase involved in cell wall biosynthesis